MNIQHFFFDGIEYPELPNPLPMPNGSKVSPMTAERFVSLGGEIRPAEHLTDKERVCVAFGELIEDLSERTDKITPEEFLAAAQNGISSDLIAFAREREVPEEVISEGRSRIVEIMSDALRFCVSWNDLIVFVSAFA